MSELTANFTRAIKEQNDSFVLSCVFFIVGSLVVLANTLIVVAVARYRHLWTRANLYVVSLSCTDIMVGLYQFMVGTTYLPATSGYFHTHKAPCVIMYAWVYFTVACSLLNMGLIAFDRYFFFSRPLHYHIVFTDRKARAAVCMVWLVAMLYGSCVFFVNKFSLETGCVVFTLIPRIYRTYTPAAIMIPIAVTIACLYSAIIRLTLKHIKFVAMQKRACAFSPKPHVHPTPAFSTCTGAQDTQSLQVDGILPSDASSSGPEHQTAGSPSSTQTPLPYRESQHSSSSKGKPTSPPASSGKGVSASPTSLSSLKSLKLFITVFGLLVIFWSPYIIAELVSVRHQVSTTAYYVALFMGFLNSGINVFVYPVFNPRFRDALKHMLTCGRVNSVRRDLR